MNSFVETAMNNRENYTRTENGALTLDSSSNDCVDLFFKVGAMRGQAKDRLENMFRKALNENPEVAVRTLLWARDVRGGAGERQVFRTLLSFLEKKYPEYLDQIFEYIPFYGRWDDLLVFNTEKYRTQAYAMFAYALRDGHGLAAKWAPREKSKNKKIANELRQFMGLDWKQYRKLLVENTNVVETLMCQKQWDSINFSHVPSLAASRYNKAFWKNAKDSYEAYVAALTKKDPSVKVNASAVYPYDVLKPLTGSIGWSYRYKSSNITQTEKDFIVAQWDALPNFLTEGKTIFPMIDLSGSMGSMVSGNITCMDVAISLGLYVADKQTGPFSGMALTFNTNPNIMKLSGNIIQKFESLNFSDWGGSTNIEAAFDKILAVAKSKNVKREDIPQYLVIISDMEFNYCARGTNFESAKKKFNDAGYELPNVVFWNVQSRNDQSPVRFDEDGTALVSGFSTDVFKSILAGDGLDPKSIMLRTVMDERYNVWK